MVDILITNSNERFADLLICFALLLCRALIRYIKLLLLVRRCQRKNVAVSDLFNHYVAKHPQKPCLIYEGREWTYRDVNDFSNRIANLFQQYGYKKGDVVGLLMENRPEFVATWLGLSKIGVIVPLINTNQRQASLIHSIEIAKCQALIFSDSLADGKHSWLFEKKRDFHFSIFSLFLFVGVAEVFDRFKSGTFNWYQYNDEVREISDKSIKNLNVLLEKAPKTDIISNPSPNSDIHHNQLLYIYTSGTTGLPKAAVITHSRYIFIAAAIHFMADFTPDDIFYTPLPLYHTAGGVMSIGQALLFGSTVVLRKKFSASGYFPDCQKYKCTVMTYERFRSIFCLTSTYELEKNDFFAFFFLWGRIGCSIHWWNVPLYLSHTTKFGRYES